MKKIEIEEKIIYILEENFNLDKEMCKNNLNKSLLISPFNLEAAELVQLVVYIMNSFCINFNSSDFTNYKFSTIQSITSVIYKESGDKNESN